MAPGDGYDSAIGKIGTIETSWCLLRWWCTGGRSARSAGTTTARATGSAASRRRRRLLFAMVASVTTDFLLSVKSGGVDVLHHLHHFPGSYLHRLFIAGTIFHVVAKIASHPQRRRNTEHDPEIVVRREHFQIGRRRHSAATTSGPTGRRTLRKRDDTEGKNKQNRSMHGFQCTPFPANDL